MIRLLCLALVPLLVCGCQAVAPAGTNAAAPTVQAPTSERTGAYLLAPGDQLEIIVHTAPELSRTVTISPDGEIRIPYSGPVQVAAKTLDAVQMLLREAMASELRNPDIDVLLISTAAAQCHACDPQIGTFNQPP
jgi:polysaccharide export outer membrane protein